MTGTVIRLMSDKGFGFIKGEDGREYFFHRSGVAQGGFDGMAQGDEVSFTPTQAAKGARAEDVEPKE